MSKNRNYPDTENNSERYNQTRFSDLYGRASKSAKQKLNSKPKPYEAEDYGDYEADDDYSRYRKNNLEDNNFNEDYDDEGYEDYGELGSNYSPEDDPNWGYDDTEAFEDYKKRGSKIYAPNSPVSPPERLDFSHAKAHIGPDAYIDEDYFDDNGRFTGKKRARNTPSRNSQQNRNSGSYLKDDSDLRNYLNAIKRYDKGELNNYEMSKIQRKYAHNPFWKTFNPSKDLIKKYGNGNESTKWPMFELKDGQWTPNIWRND